MPGSRLQGIEGTARAQPRALHHVSVNLRGTLPEPRVSRQLPALDVGHKVAGVVDGDAESVSAAIIEVTRSSRSITGANRGGDLRLMEDFAPIGEDDLGNRRMRVGAA